MEIEFKIGENTYRAGKMNAMKQFHVARRIAPVVGSLVALTRGAPAMDEILQPIAEAIAKLSDGDCEYVLGACLSAVQRQSGQGWAAVWDSRVGRLMFEDIDLPAMIQIATRVLQDNLAPFFSGLQSGSPSAETAAGAPT